jgi:ketosteroid isomerase-like protein
MTRSGFERWLADYGAAWERGDPDAVLGLFAPDAAYHETPFEPAMVGAEAIRRYWADGARDGQTEVRFEAQVVACDGATGYARWSASFRRVPSGRFVELDGMLAARFDDTQRCVEFREWWHRRER